MTGISDVLFAPQKQSGNRQLWIKATVLGKGRVKLSPTPLVRSEMAQPSSGR